VAEALTIVDEPATAVVPDWVAKSGKSIKAEHLPIIELGIFMIFEYGSSSTGMMVTSSLSWSFDFSTLFIIDEFINGVPI
jgi:hypothetical protein